MNITLQPITEENFLDAFNLKLKKEQESFVSHPVRSLAQAYVYRDQCQPFGIYHEDSRTRATAKPLCKRCSSTSKQSRSAPRTASRSPAIRKMPPLCTSIPPSALRPQVQSMTMKSSSCSTSKIKYCVQKKRKRVPSLPRRTLSLFFLPFLVIRAD